MTFDLFAKTGSPLSPAYDMNPVYLGTGLTLNISEKDNALDFELARSVAPYFRMSDQQADEIIKQVKVARKNRSAIATPIGISRSEQEMMESAFIEG